MGSIVIQGCGMERSSSSNTATIVIESPKSLNKAVNGRASDEQSIPAEVTEIIFKLSALNGETITEYDLLLQSNIEFTVLAGRSYALIGSAKANEEVLFYGEKVITPLNSGEVRQVGIELQAQLKIALNIQQQSSSTEKPTAIQIPVGAGAATQFEIDLQGLQNKTVAWYVNDILGGDAEFGTINQLGEYTPPQALPENSNIQLKVIPETAPSFSAVIDIELFENPDDKPIVDVETDTQAPIVSVSLAAGIYNSEQTLLVNCDDCTTIYYTLDGSIPDENSSRYSTSIAINESVLIKLFAEDEFGNRSEIQSYSYLIDTDVPESLVQPISGTYGSTQLIELSCQDCSAIYYSLGDEIPNLNSLQYSSPIEVSLNQTIRYFSIDLAGNREVVRTASYVIDTETPISSIDPQPGLYYAPQTVSLTCDSCNTIYYTTDGTQPTLSSSTYAEPFTVSTESMIAFFAVDGVGNQELIQSANYQIAELSAPEDFQVVADENQVTLSWASVVGADSYSIYRSTVPDVMTNGTEIQRLVENSYLDINVVNKQKYYYAVSANSANFSGLLTQEREAQPDMRLTSINFTDTALAECVVGLGVEFVYQLTNLSCENLAISDLSGIEFLVNLQILKLSGNNIVDLQPLTGLTSLTGLWVSNNSIVNIQPLGNLLKLENLELESNAITDISPLANLSRMRSLTFFDNAVTDIEAVAGMHNLTSLWAYNNNIVDLSALAGLTELLSLYLFSNSITDITPLGNLTKLTALDLHSNSIENIDVLSALTELRNLELGKNNISDLSALTALTNIETIDLALNQIADISPLSGLVSLNKLWLGYNNISNVDELASLTQLNTLSLRSNSVEDIGGLSPLTALISLNLESNRINDISPVANLTELLSLDLQQNSVTDVSVLRSLTALDTIFLNNNDISTGLDGLSNITITPTLIDLQENLNLPCEDIGLLDALYDVSDGASSGAVIWTSCI